MALDSEEKIIQEGGNDKKGFVVTFTNGTLEQLEELREFLKAPDKLEVIKLGISFLQRYKDQEKSKKNTDQTTL